MELSEVPLSFVVCPERVTSLVRNVVPGVNARWLTVRSVVYLVLVKRDFAVERFVALRAVTCHVAVVVDCLTTDRVV